MAAQETGSGYVPIASQNIEMYHSEFAQQYNMNAATGDLTFRTRNCVGAGIDYNTTKAAIPALTNAQYFLQLFFN